MSNENTPRKDSDFIINPFHFENPPSQKRTYKGYEKKSYYLTMRDDIKIAIELITPKNLKSEDKLPTILLQTRYWRDYEFRFPFKWFIKDFTWGYKKIFIK